MPDIEIPRELSPTIQRILKRPPLQIQPWPHLAWHSQRFSSWKELLENFDGLVLPAQEGYLRLDLWQWEVTTDLFNGAVEQFPVLADAGYDFGLTTADFKHGFTIDWTWEYVPDPAFEPDLCIDSPLGCCQAIEPGRLCQHPFTSIEGFHSMSAILHLTDSITVHWSTLGMAAMYDLIADEFPEEEAEVARWLHDVSMRSTPHLDFDLRGLPLRGRIAFIASSHTAFQKLQERFGPTPPANGFSYRALQDLCAKLKALEAEIPRYPDVAYSGEPEDLTQIWFDEELTD